MDTLSIDPTLCLIPIKARPGKVFATPAKKAQPYKNGGGLGENST